MRLANPIREFESVSEVKTRLLIMFADTGIHFMVVHGSRTRPEKEFSIRRNHFEPWDRYDIRTVQNGELCEKLEQGCRWLLPAVKEVSPSILEVQLGVKEMESDEIVVCFPSAWSLRKGCDLKVVERFHGKPWRVSEHFTRKLNTQELLGLDADAYRYVLFDASVAYFLDNGARLQAAPINQRFQRLHYQVEFILGERDKYEAVKRCLNGLWQDFNIVWTSDCSKLAHLLPAADTVLIDIDKLSVCIHGNTDGVGFVTCDASHGIQRFLHQLARQLNELGFTAEDFDRENSERLFGIPTTGSRPVPVDLEYAAKGVCSRKSIEGAMENIPQSYWDTLMGEIDTTTAATGEPRRMVVIGDSPTYLFCLSQAAATRSWEAAAVWPNIHVNREKSEHAPSARAAFRAMEIFHQQPFSKFHVSNLPLSRTGNFLKTAAKKAGTFVLFLLQFIAAIAIQKLAARLGIETRNL